MFQHLECSACIWITEGPSMRHLLTFRMFFQGTHFWAFCRLASSCPALTLAREGGQLWVPHRIYNYKQRTAMSYTNDIMKHQKHSETLSSQLQCSGSKVWTYFRPLAIYQLLTNLQHCSPCKRSLNATPREHISCQLATMLPGSSEKMWKAMPWNESNSIQVAMLRCTVQNSKIRIFRARVVFHKPPNSNSNEITWPCQNSKFTYRFHRPWKLCQVTDSFWDMLLMRAPNREWWCCTAVRE